MGDKFYSCKECGHMVARFEGDWYHAKMYMGLNTKTMVADAVYALGVECEEDDCECVTPEQGEEWDKGENDEA